MYRLTRSLKAFLRDDRGLILVEGMLMMPLLIWAFIALMVYWDLFRTMNVTQKAAYSIADLLSRQSVVTTNFVDGLQEVADFLAPESPDVRMRITSMQYDAGEDEYVWLWSLSPGGKVAVHDQGSIQDLRPLIPIMDDLDSVIIVETWVDYEPDFDTGTLNFAPGVEGQTFTQFIVTRPRNRRVCLDGTNTCV